MFNKNTSKVWKPKKWKNYEDWEQNVGVSKVFMAIYDNKPDELNKLLENGEDFENFIVPDLDTFLDFASRGDTINDSSYSIFTKLFYNCVHNKNAAEVNLAMKNTMHALARDNGLDKTPDFEKALDNRDKIAEIIDKYDAVLRIS